MGVHLQVAPARTGSGRRGKRAKPPARDEHPIEALQRTIGNQATTLLIQRRDAAASPDVAEGKATDPKPLRPDASQEELHAEYVRGKEMYDLGLFEEAAAVWTPVYAHPMTRADGAKKASLGLVIGRAQDRAGNQTTAISWWEEVIVTPGAEALVVATARKFIVAARRGSEQEQGGGDGESLPPDATDEDLYAAYLDGLGLYRAGLFDEAASKWLAVYEHPNLGTDRRSGIAMLIGNARYHAHKYDQAISWYQESLETEGADPGMTEYIHDKIAACRRGSTEAAGLEVGEPIDPDAGDDVLAAQYHEATDLYHAGLFEASIAKMVPVYEHKNVGDDKRALLGLRIGMAHHQVLQFGPAVSWYTETLVRGGLEDVDAVMIHRKLAQARNNQPMVSTAIQQRPTISQGWTGTHVRVLQERLKAFGFDLAVDGIFGGETAGQVRQIQTNNGLKADGIVGPRTWAVLS